MSVPRRARSARRCRPARSGRLNGRRDGPMIVCLAAALGSSTLARRADGQGREQRRYGSGAPEAKLMLYYSSTLAFSPLGSSSVVERGPVADGGARRRMVRAEASVELSYVPPLSAEQRTTVSDKPESTNLAPLFARPRLALRLPAGIGLETGWIPPVRVFDVRANLIAAAVSRSFSPTPRTRIVPRASFLSGRVEGAITCNRETARNRGAALATYFAFVCHGNNSRDFFEPGHVSAELLLSRLFAGGRWEPYLSGGARGERTRFDIGVIGSDGKRDSDNPVLEVRSTRGYGTAGASWRGARRTRLAAEVYYAPGSAVTVRALAGIGLW